MENLSTSLAEPRPLEGDPRSIVSTPSLDEWASARRGVIPIGEHPPQLLQVGRLSCYSLQKWRAANCIEQLHLGKGVGQPVNQLQRAERIEPSMKMARHRRCIGRNLTRVRRCGEKSFRRHLAMELVDIGAAEGSASRLEAIDEIAARWVGAE